MWASLSKLTPLAGDTLVYCAHEYTAGNARFAAHVDAGNAGGWPATRASTPGSFHGPRIASQLTAGCPRAAPQPTRLRPAAR
jgi:glyoxylase-like metal-dependent hydrolase (beta-lactamase superfamily II)